jgi:hypothetical protein
MESCPSDPNGSFEVNVSTIIHVGLVYLVFLGCYYLIAFMRYKTVHSKTQLKLFFVPWPLKRS